MILLLLSTLIASTTASLTVGATSFDPQFDHAVSLLDSPRIETQIFNLEAYTKIKLAREPWSGSYWPTKDGQIAARYADPDRNTTSWKNAYIDWLTRPGGPIFFSRDSKKIDRLSPAEKYDLLMGDLNFTLTRANWQKGFDNGYDKGKELFWEGLCDGWALASMYYVRPSIFFTAYAYDGTPITFYPDDVKALATLLAANAGTPPQGKIRFAGKRCSKDQDPAACADNNPATVHLALTNRVGIENSHLAIDIDRGPQVWNHVVRSYSIQYSNPMNFKRSTSLQQSLIPLSQYRNDPHQGKRARNTAYIVGVKLNVDIADETLPIHRGRDYVGYDSIQTLEYEYDLELDSQYRIIGGEWLSITRPDFMWSLSQDYELTTSFDQWQSGTWNHQGIVPEMIRSTAPQASRKGLPLAVIVDELVRAAMPY